MMSAKELYHRQMDVAIRVFDEFLDTGLAVYLTKWNTPAVLESGAKLAENMNPKKLDGSIANLI